MCLYNNHFWGDMIVFLKTTTWSLAKQVNNSQESGTEVVIPAAIENIVYCVGWIELVKLENRMGFLWLKVPPI